MNNNLVNSNTNYIVKNKSRIKRLRIMKYLFAILCCGIIAPGITCAQTVEDYTGPLQVEQEQYTIKKTGDIIVKIFGSVDLDRFEEASLLLTHINPDEKSVTHNISVTSQGYYEFYFVHNWDSIRGDYEVFVSKNAIPVGNVAYELVQDPSYKTDEQVKEEFLIEKDVETNLTVADYKTGFTIEADAVEGSKLITITGRASSNIIPITIIVLAPNENIISIDQLTPDSNGSFTSDINVGGPMWKQDGIYTITGQQGSGLLNKSTVEVEIVDGAVIPEFGTIASLVLVVAISSIVILSAKSRLRF